MAGYNQIPNIQPQNLAGYNNQNQIPWNQSVTSVPWNQSVTPINNNLISNTPYENYYNIKNNQNQQFLKCRPVSSKEEAMACQIDLDGSLWVFVDLPNQKIYTRQVDINGNAPFNTYVFTEEKPQQFVSGDYVTKEEFNKVIQSLIANINSQQIQSQPLSQPKNQSMDF